MYNMIKRRILETLLFFDSIFIWILTCMGICRIIKNPSNENPNFDTLFYSNYLFTSDSDYCLVYIILSIHFWAMIGHKSFYLFNIIFIIVSGIGMFLALIYDCHLYWGTSFFITIIMIYFFLIQFKNDNK